jgi:rhamnogalacturonan acetylesterase
MLAVLSTSVLLALAASARAAPGALQKRAPTIYLAGDSTMAEGGGGTSTQGSLLGVDSLRRCAMI